MGNLSIAEILREARTGNPSATMQTTAAHCPSCLSFGQECNPEVEDYDTPCDASKTGGDN